MVIVNGWRMRYKKKKPPKKPLMKCYESRNEKIGTLGYSGYVEYLKSDDWKKIRAEKLRWYPSCLLCSHPANQVHHTSYAYEVLLGMFPQLLVTLCEKCHGAIEFSGSRKRTLKQANAELYRLAHDAGRGGWLRMWNEHKHRILARQKQIRKDARKKRK